MLIATLLPFQTTTDVRGNPDRTMTDLGTMTVPDTTTDLRESPVTTPLEMRLEVDTTTGEVAVTRTALDTEQKFRIWKQGLIY